VANSINLTAQHAVTGTFPFIASPAITPAASVIPAVTVTPARSFRTSVITDADRFAFTLFRVFAICVRPFFVEFIRFMRLIGDRFGRAFAFGRFIHRRWNIFILVTRTIFALAKIVFFTRAWFFAEPGFFRGIIFARRPIVTAPATAAAPTWWRATTTSAASATATCAPIPIT